MSSRAGRPTPAFKCEAEFLSCTPYCCSPLWRASSCRRDKAVVRRARALRLRRRRLSMPPHFPPLPPAALDVTELGDVFVIGDLLRLAAGCVPKPTNEALFGAFWMAPLSIASQNRRTNLCSALFGWAPSVKRVCPNVKRACGAALECVPKPTNEPLFGSFWMSTEGRACGTGLPECEEGLRRRSRMRSKTDERTFVRHLSNANPNAFNRPPPTKTPPFLGALFISGSTPRTQRSRGRRRAESSLVAAPCAHC